MVGRREEMCAASLTYTECILTVWRNSGIPSVYVTRDTTDHRSSSSSPGTQIFFLKLHYQAFLRGHLPLAALGFNWKWLSSKISLKMRTKIIIWLFDWLLWSSASGLLTAGCTCNYCFTALSVSSAQWSPKLLYCPYLVFARFRKVFARYSSVEWSDDTESLAGSACLLTSLPPSLPPTWPPSTTGGLRGMDDFATSLGKNIIFLHYFLINFDTLK